LENALTGAGAGPGETSALPQMLPTWFTVRDTSRTDPPCA
jgi:hypothetical protein